MDSTGAAARGFQATVDRGGAGPHLAGGSAPSALRHTLPAPQMRTSHAAALLLLAAAGCAPRPAPAPPAPAPLHVPALAVLPREAWGAAGPVAPMRRHAPHHITIHHTAGRQRAELGLREKLQGLQRFSQTAAPLGDGRVKQPWPDVPYHFYVDAAGQVAQARDTAYAGDTNTRYDPSGHLLVVLEGNFEEEYPTAPQMESLRRLVLVLARQWGVPASRIGKHNDFADTACPGDHLEVWLPQLRELVGER